MVKQMHRSYSSAGLCPSTYYKYGQVVAILSLLVSTSTLLLLLITLVDVGKGEEQENSLILIPKHQREEQIIKTIKTVTILYIILQVTLLLAGLRYLLCCTTSSTFVLTLGVKERNSKTLTRYGATAETESPVNKDDITVFYHRATGGNCPRSCEPLSLPGSGWLLPGQGVCLLLSLLLFLLHLILVFHDVFYTTITVVILVNFIQQFFQVILTYINSTDTGFCCLCFSITRWFVHVDFYTKMLQSIVVKKFRTSSGQPIVAEWFRTSLAQQGELDRAGEVRLLQHLLETTHDQLYRQALPSQDVVSLFLTHREMRALNQFYIKESVENQDEHVLFDVGAE